jgi:predicted nuclease with TOPRIM domain
MNENIDKLISKIEDEIRTASVRFELVLSLFSSNDNLEIINNTAPAVFGEIRSALYESVIMALNRLCDPQESYRYKNISLERLRNSLPEEMKDDTEFSEQLIAIEKQIKEEVDKLKKIRNKRFSHNDLSTHFKNEHKIIQNPAINKSLELMDEYINHVRLKHNNTSGSLIKLPYVSKDGPTRLMKYLKLGMQNKK